MSSLMASKRSARKQLDHVKGEKVRETVNLSVGKHTIEGSIHD